MIRGRGLPGGDASVVLRGNAGAQFLDPLAKAAVQLVLRQRGEHGNLRVGQQRQAARDSEQRRVQQLLGRAFAGQLGPQLSHDILQLLSVCVVIVTDIRYAVKGGKVESRRSKVGG